MNLITEHFLVAQVSIYELSQHGKIIRLKGTERIDPSNIKLSPVQSTTIFAPVELCFEKVISIIESLQEEKQDTPRDVRKSRCTGAAISAAISLASQFPNFVGRIMCFVSGACTYGPGAIVSLRKKHIIRQRNDIIQGKHKKAKKVCIDLLLIEEITIFIHINVCLIVLRQAR